MHSVQFAGLLRVLGDPPNLGKCYIDVTKLTLSKRRRPLTGKLYSLRGYFGCLIGNDRFRSGSPGFELDQFGACTASVVVEHLRSTSVVEM